MITRRGFIGGLVGIIAAPAIIRVASLMPVKAIPDPNVLTIEKMKAMWVEVARHSSADYYAIVNPATYQKLCQISGLEAAKTRGNGPIEPYKGMQIFESRYVPAPGIMVVRPGFPDA